MMMRPTSIFTAGGLIICSIGAIKILSVSGYLNKDRRRPWDVEGHDKHEKQSNSDSAESKDGVTEDPIQKKCIYLDYNGTTPIKKEVVNAMLPFLTTYFGNPSSSHAYGQTPKSAIKNARREIASLLLSPDERVDTELVDKVASGIVFTGCGTEADNMAIYLAIQAFKTNNSESGVPHIVTTNVEHPAIAQYLQYLEQLNQVTVTYVPVNSQGFVTSKAVIEALNSNTCLVTLMLANNETGALMPVAEVSRECRQRGVLCHTDAAQAVGKVPIYLKDSLGNVDMVTLVGHKFGAPKGVAALYIRQECLGEAGRQSPSWFGSSGGLLLGGGQEGGRRAGTENVPYIVGMGKAAAMVASSLESDAVRMEALRQRLYQNLIDLLGADCIRVNGPVDQNLRLPNTLSVSLRLVQSGNLLRDVGHELAASAGAACHSNCGAGQISAVLNAMKVPMDFAPGTLRLSVGFGTTEDDVDQAAKIISREAKKQWNK